MTDAKYENQFVNAVPDYKRETNMHEYYVKDAAKYLSIMTGESEEKTRQYVVRQLQKGGKFEFNGPKIEYLERGDNGDRVLKEGTLFKYVQDSLQNKEAIAPSFTTYLHPDIKKSVIAKLIENNLLGRNKAKKEMFVARAVGDTVLEDIKAVEQKGKKLSNNAISGAHVSASTPLFNRTAHSALTSTCRVTSGYGNANNEKFLLGNRHYFNYQIVLNNIVAIVNNTDYEALSAVVDKYKLHVPSVQDTIECIAYSTSLYWWDRKNAQIIQDLVNKLDPLQRAAFVYSGDAYHLRKHNRELMFNFLTKLSNKITGEHPDPMTTIKACPENYVNLAHQICYKETMGIGKDYTKIKDPVYLHTLALTLENIADTVYEYRDLIKALWMPEIVPASVSTFPTSVRRAALTSDTDSTIFTVQDWIIWYHGKAEFTERTKAVYAAAVFLASATITHVLARMSANLGIIEKEQRRIKMKSEFSFDVFVPTQLGKHYYAVISCQEGNVFPEDHLEYEIKGAQLRSANAPKDVVEDAKKMMKDILHKVMDNKKLSKRFYLEWVAGVERSIADSLKKGELRYLRKGSIKDAGSYAGEPEESPYQNHYLWNEVFGPKYGMMENPPYDTLKISTTIDKPSKLKAWLDAMEDRELAARMVNYLARMEKREIGTFNLPKPILEASGIPKEVIDVIDIEGVQTDICKIYYVLLESLGHYSMGDKIKRLVSKTL